MENRGKNKFDDLDDEDLLLYDTNADEFIRPSTVLTNDATGRMNGVNDWLSSHIDSVSNNVSNGRVGALENSIDSPDDSPLLINVSCVDF